MFLYRCIKDILYSFLMRRGMQWRYNVQLQLSILYPLLFIWICLFVYLFFGGLTSDSRIFHSFLPVKYANFELCSALMTIAQWGFFSLPHLLWHETSISEAPWYLHLLPSVWQEAITTCFYDLGLSGLGFDHPTFRMRSESSDWLHHRGCYTNLQPLTGNSDVFILKL